MGRPEPELRPHTIPYQIKRAIRESHSPCRVNVGPALVLLFRTLRTDIFCIEDVDDAPVYH